MVDRIERNKDLIQEMVESTASHVGSIATIITTAVADVAREIGEIITDGFEMREAAQRARDDERVIIDAELADIDDEPELPDPDDSVAEIAAPRTERTTIDPPGAPT